MAQISIGGAAGEGFSVIRRHPLSVLLWGLIYIGVLAAGLSLLAPTLLGIFIPIIQAAQSGGTASPPDVQAMMPRMLQLQGVSMLFNLGLLLVRAVLLCAVFRSVLHPERSLFGYVRLGMAEFFIAILTFAAGIVAFIVALIVIAPLAVAVGVTAAGHHWAAAAGIGVVGVLILTVALIYVALRFSLLGPMIVQDGRFHFGDAWAVTRGHVGSLFLVALLLFLILLVAEFLVSIVMTLVGGGMFAAIIGMNGFASFFQQPLQVIVSKLLPAFVVFAVLWVPLTGCAMAIVCAPWARAYKDLITVTPAPVAFEPSPPPPAPPSPEPTSPEPTPPGPAPELA